MVALAYLNSKLAASWVKSKVKSNYSLSRFHNSAHICNSHGIWGCPNFGISLTAASFNLWPSLLLYQNVCSKCAQSWCGTLINATRWPTNQLTSTTSNTSPILSLSLSPSLSLSLSISIYAHFGPAKVAAAIKGQPANRTATFD